MNLLAPMAWAALALGGQDAPAPPAPDSPPSLGPAATLDDTLEIGGEAVDARQRRTRMVVPVLINGTGPYSFVVDSGADRTVIGSTLARQLALPAEADVTLNGTAGISKVSTVMIDSLTVGGSRIDSVTAPALPEAFIGAQGLLGIDALAEQRMMIDFVRKTVRIEDARRPVPLMPGEIVVTARRRRGQLIVTQAAVGRTDVSAIIDTGTEITIGNMALHAKLFGRRRPLPKRPVEITSVTGQKIVADLTVVPAIKLGTFTILNVAVAFVDAPPFALFGLADRPALLLGTDMLEAFRRVSLDFRRRRVRFQER